MAINRLLPHDRHMLACYRPDQVIGNSIQAVSETSFDYYYRCEVYHEPQYSIQPYLFEPQRNFGNLSDLKFKLDYTFRGPS